VRVVPKQFILESTNRCNLMCRYCPSVENTGKFPVGDMSIELFKSIVDRIAVEAPGSTPLSLGPTASPSCILSISNDAVPQHQGPPVLYHH